MIDPFTIALATFGIQKLRGKSTRMALKDAALVGGTAYGIGALSGGFGAGAAGQAAGTAGTATGIGTGTATTAGALTPASVTTAGGVTVPMNTTVGLSTTPAAPITQPSFLSRVGAGVSKAGEGIKGLFGRSPMTAEQVNAMTPAEIAKTGMTKAELMKGSGFMGLGTGEKIGLGIAGSTLLAGDEEQPEPPFTEADYEKASAEQKERMAGAFERATPQQNSQASVYNYGDTGMYTFNTGGIVNLETMPKYNTGGINYLPSKVDHDENDSNNYVRAHGYVEDGSGNGDKDEDTILAQLADGEFVSRADAILGAGIIEGADPKNYKDMRRKGAAFFYDQQSKFKRVFDMIDASRAKSSKAN